jgi:hypothetical protein
MFPVYCEITCNYTGYYYMRVTNETIQDPDGWVPYSLEIDIKHPTPPPFDLRGYVKDFVEDYYDCEGIRMKIKKIRDEDNHKIADTWVKGVKVYCEIDITEDFDDPDEWEEEEDNEKFVIVDPDEKFYHRYLGLIIAENVDWDDTAEDIENDYEFMKANYPYHYGTYAYDIKEVKASERDNGLKISLTAYNDEMDDIKVYRDYDDNGVLEHGEVDYGGVTVMKIDLEISIVEQILEDPIALALLISLIGAAAAAVVIIRFLIKRRNR